MKLINGNIIKISLPKTTQEKDYTCGAAIVRSIFSYWGVMIETEDEYCLQLETDDKEGTNPQKIIEMAKRYGFKVKHSEMFNMRQLKYYLSRGKTFICMIQAWGSGHYIAPIGYDKDNFYFADPYLYHGRGYLSYKEFDRRWKINGYDHYGIILWKNKRSDFIEQAIFIEE